MFSSGWRYLLGILCLAMLMSSGHAQEGKKQPELPANEQEAAPANLPVPLPIVVIESEEATLARLSAEEEARDREQRDILAQEGMDAATRRMAKYGFWQTWLIALGTAALLYTLWLTRQANRAAQNAVDVTSKIGYGQLRPYVGLLGIDRKRNQNGSQLQPIWKNFGQTPAVNVQCMLGWDILDFVPDENFGYADRLPIPTKIQLPPGKQVELFGPELLNATEIQLGKTSGKLYLWGWIEYSDSMTPEVRHRTEFCNAFTIDEVRQNWKLIEVGPHNGADSECLKKPHTK